MDGRPLDDVHGVGWRLVTVDGDAAAVDPAVLDWFAGIGGRLVVLDRADPTTDRWFGDHPVAWALQRPDFHLYGTAATAADATELLGHLRSELRVVAQPVPGGPS